MFYQLTVNLRGTGEVSQGECRYKQAGGITDTVTKTTKRSGEEGKIM